MTKFIERMYKMFPWVNVNTGLLFLRIGVGAIFIITGYMKVSDMPQTVGYFATLGFSAFWAYLVGVVELLGGITVLLGIGIYTRVSAKLLSIVMLVAMYLLRSNFEMEMTPLLMFFVTFAIICTGPGKYAVLKEKTE
ncbi:MAG: DoxX family protein [Candidatus Pacebacteria bacterium]|nr:DoxX family protein [Candidatus Paceibacterota bacterium]